MAALAAIVMQGMRQGTQDSRYNGEQQQQLMMLAHQLGQEQAGRNALLSQMDTLNPAPMPTMDLYGQGAGDTDMGPPSQQPNPQLDQWHQTRDLMSKAPLSVVQRYASGYQETDQRHRDLQMQQQMQEDQRTRDMAKIRSARDQGFSADNGNLSMVPEVMALHHKYGIPTAAGTSPEMFAGLQQTPPNPSAMNQAHNAGLNVMPFFKQPGQIDPQDLMDLQNPDPGVSGQAKARILNSQNPSAVRALFPHTSTGKAAPTPQEAAVRAQQFIDAAGGEQAFDPVALAAIKDRAALGQTIPAGLVLMGVKQGSDMRKAESGLIKMEHADATHELAAAERDYSAALSFVSYDKDALRKEHPEIVAAVLNGKAKLSGIEERMRELTAPVLQPRDPMTATPSGSTASRAGKGGVGGVSGPSGASAMSKEDAIAKAWSELGPGADKERWKARVQELMGGGR